MLSWSFLEAMSAECLMVASNTAPVKEVITNESNGLLVDMNSIDHISKTLDYALNNQNQLTHLKKAARQTIIQNYDLDDCLKKQLHLIESCFFKQETIYIS